ncbi:MAG: SDR family NAD(P)-dependent oxidoreductase [Anaerolineales bacterium]|nr:SDR family NAD(P)-dependent oxidoreductase [Anaerolineales bacterium]
MRILLTGAFGNVGRSALAELVRRGHHVRCFDLRTPANQRAARRLAPPAEVAWGDLRRPADVAAAAAGCDVVVHLAFIVPKLSATGVESEARPDWAREINVGGTRNLIDAMRALAQPPRLIFASSLHVYGRTQDQPPPRTAADPVRPIEHYARHKVECERMVRASGLDWCILRFGAVLPLAMKLDKGMFDVPLDNRIEFVHTLDVGLAIANAVESSRVWGKVLLLGGGPPNQLYYRELNRRILAALGVGELPAGAFATQPFATDWLDTTESEALLRYQTRTLDDYIHDMQTVVGYRRHLIRLLRPLVRWWLLRQSPNWRRAARRLPVPGQPARVAVVTGASGSIGRATALRLAREGYAVVAVGRDQDRLDRLVAEVQADGGQAAALAVDLSDERACEQVFERATRLYGPADVLVNSAGFGWYGFGETMPWPTALEMLQVNVVAVARLTLLFLASMKQRGRGAIINVGSVVGGLPSQGAALYAATKSFVDTFTTSLFRELRGSAVTVSVVRPGAVRSEFFDRAARLSAGRRIPGAGLAVRPETVAERIAGLLKRPRRYVYVPGILRIVPWVELTLGWLIDRLGPVALGWKARGGAKSGSG